MQPHFEESCGTRHRASRHPLLHFHSNFLHALSRYLFQGIDNRQRYQHKKPLRWSWRGAPAPLSKVLWKWPWVDLTKGSFSNPPKVGKSNPTSIFGSANNGCLLSVSTNRTTDQPLVRSSSRAASCSSIVLQRECGILICWCLWFEWLSLNE